MSTVLNGHVTSRWSHTADQELSKCRTLEVERQVVTQRQEISNNMLLSVIKPLHLHCGYRVVYMLNYAPAPPHRSFGRKHNRFAERYSRATHDEHSYWQFGQASMRRTIAVESTVSSRQVTQVLFFLLLNVNSIFQLVS